MLKRLFDVNDPAALLGVSLALALALTALAGPYRESTQGPELKLLVVNGLLFIQPLLFFLMRLPSAIKIFGLIVLVYVAWELRLDIMAHLGFGSTHGKGNGPLYWLTCAITGVFNVVALIYNAARPKNW
jgi:hypothetical protein